MTMQSDAMEINVSDELWAEIADDPSELNAAIEHYCLSAINGDPSSDVTAPPITDCSTRRAIRLESRIESALHDQAQDEGRRVADVVADAIKLWRS